MGVRWAVAFAAAALLALTGGAWLRARARRVRWLRQAGGATLLVAAPVGVLAASPISGRAALFAVFALVLGVLGLIDERIALPRWVTPFALVVAGTVATAEGLRFHIIGVEALDIVWTIAFLAAGTAAVAALGNADGLTAGIVAAMGTGVLAVAGFADQGAATVAAAALVGAALGFLAYNARPASLFLGRSGGLFAGFMLATGALWMRPAIGAPDRLAVPLILFALPLADAAIVILSRLRHRRRLSTRYRDHLSHRLRASRRDRGQSVAMLVAVQVVFAVIAVFVARGVLSVSAGVPAALVVLGVLVAAALRGRVSSGDAEGFSRRAWAVAFLVVGFVVVASVPAAVAAVRARDKVNEGRDLARDALRAARRGEPQRAARLFAEAEQVFREVRDMVDTPLTLPALAVPVLGPNVHAARELAAIGTDLARAGRTLTASVDPDKLRIVDGRVPLEEVALVAPKLDNAAQLLTRSRERLRDIDSVFLLAEVSDGIDKIERELTQTAKDAVRAAAAAELAPAILGQDRPRTYFVAIQNPAELRGTGGLIGNWGILTADNGEMTLSEIHPLGELNYRRGDPPRVLHAPADYKRRYGKFDPENEWHPVNLSPDWPTVAAVIADLYPQSGGTAVDGVIAVDPLGLAALLELTGPVRVEGWPDRIGADNVVEVTLRDAYGTFDQGLNLERKDFLGDVAQEAVDKATEGDLGKPAEVGKYLGGAAHEGHISLWFADPDEERVARVLDVAGRVPRPVGDSLLVVNVNGAGNKLDYYLQRTIEYTARISPDDELRRAQVDGVVAVGLTNTAPASGLPRAVAGPAEGSEALFVAGQNRALVSVYTPLRSTAARLGDAVTGIGADLELGRNVYSATMDLLAGQANTLEVDVSGTVALDRGGWYELTLIRQPTLYPDQVQVRLSAPDGFEIVAAKGLEVVDGEARGIVELSETTVVRVRLGRSDDRSLWDRLQDGP